MRSPEYAGGLIDSIMDLADCGHAVFDFPFIFVVIFSVTFLSE